MIKNVAGYDLAKLFTGSFGTLGMILSVNVRLHPVLRRTATAVARSTIPAVSLPPLSDSRRRRWNSSVSMSSGTAAPGLCSQVRGRSCGASR